MAPFESESELPIELVLSISVGSCVQASGVVGDMRLVPELLPDRNGCLLHPCIRDSLERAASPMRALRAVRPHDPSCFRDRSRR